MFLNELGEQLNWVTSLKELMSTFFPYLFSLSSDERLVKSESEDSSPSTMPNCGLMLVISFSTWLTLSSDTSDIFAGLYNTCNKEYSTFNKKSLYYQYINDITKR